MVQCDQEDMGCQGGWMNKAWDYIKEHGVVSDACDPYTSGGGVTGQCPLTSNTCVNASVPFKKYQTKDAYRLTTGEDIQYDIMESGPVEGAFLVPPSFFNYKQGVFVPQPNEGTVGGHAIKILGWGVENGIK